MHVRDRVALRLCVCVFSERLIGGSSACGRMVLILAAVLVFSLRIS